MKWVAGLVLTMLVVSGCVSNLQLAGQALDAGEYDKAANLLNNLALNGDERAQYGLGHLWEHGLGSTPRNEAEATEWFRRSANQGFPPSMFRLGILLSRAGQEDAAVSWLNLAARWGDESSISALRKAGRTVPPPDLLQQAEAKKAEDDQSIDAMTPLLGGLLCLSSQVFCEPSNNAYTTRPTHKAPQVLTQKRCDSDFSCNYGDTCVKEPFSSVGVCMRPVDSHGIRQFQDPSTGSIGPNMDYDGQCRFNTDCPVGFRCDSTYKTCVRSQ